MSTDRNPRLPSRLKRRGRLAQGALLWERSSPILWPSVGFLGLYVAAASFGLGAAFPFAAPIMAGLMAIAALVSAGYGARDFRFPTLNEGLRRLETDGGLRHRPYTAFDDRMAAGGSDAGAALWRRHQDRARANLPETTPRPPFATFARRDPYGLRLLTLFAVVAGFAAAGDQWPARVLRFDGGAFGFGRPPALNAWIDPPAYTGRPPMFLSRNGVPAGPDAVVAPVSSTLAIRLSGEGDKGRLRIRGEGVREDMAMTVDEALGLSLDATLDQAARYEVRAGGRVAEWRIDLLPDADPVVTFTETPGRNDRGELAFGYAADDDYGVERLELVLSLAAAPEREPVSRPLAAGGDFIDAETALDFSDHPWAGLEVSARLKAVDGAGQEGWSDAVEVTLPARLFTDDLAKAAAHERRELVHTPEGTATSAAALDALVALPDQYFDYDSGVYIAVKSALMAVMRGGEADIERAQDFLWAAALMAEGDDVEAARRAVQAAQRALMEALSGDASEQEIADRLAELREAINRLMEALAKDALENFAENGQQGAPGGPGGGDLNQDELQALLEQLEQLTDEGARGAAQELLAQLRDLLENLQMQIAQGGGGQGQQMPSMFGDGLQELSDIIGRQRELLDDTFDNARRAQENAGDGERRGGQDQPGGGESGDRGEAARGDGAQDGDRAGEGDRSGAGGEPGDGERGTGPGGSEDLSAEDIARLQRELSERLSGARDNFEGSDDDGARAALDEAERAMRRSENALREGELGEALANQRNAIDNLREGAERLAQEDLRNSEEFAEGLDGESTDPLGRAFGATGPSAGRGVGDIPGEGELGSAREILEALRERATDPNLPAEERAYLLRLLDRFRR